MSPENHNSTPWHLNLFIGCAIGITDAYITHPLWAAKTLVQQGKPLTANWRVLFRGVGVHAASSVPLDAIQTAASRIFMENRSFFAHSRWDDSSNATKRIASGLLGGGIGALISSPSEMIMIRQAEKGEKACKAIKGLWSEGKLGRFYKGFLPTLGRDSLFCCGFFAGVPILTRKFENEDVHPAFATIAAGIISGSITAVISQPFDTVKTLVQSEKSLTPRKAVQVIYQERGIEGMFSGLLFRMARVTLGVLILGTMNDSLEKILLKKSYQE